MKSLFEELGGTYHREGDYMIPDLIAPEAPKIGIWGMRRRDSLLKAYLYRPAAQWKAERPSGGNRPVCQRDV